MKLSDIIVFDERKWFLSPFQIIIKPSEKTRSFLFKIINDSFFIKSLKELRHKYNFPINGYSAKLLKNFKQSNFGKYKGTKKEFEEMKVVNGTYDIKPLWLKMRKDIKDLVSHYNYSHFYDWAFFILVTHNAFIEYKYEKDSFIQYYSRKSTLQFVLKKSKDPIAGIFIKGNISKNEFKKWIDNHWDTIEDIEGLDFFPIKWDLSQIMPKIIKERGTLKNIEINEKIVYLIRKGKTYREIYECLIESFPNEDKVYGQEWVNLRISRLKKKLNLA